MIKPVKTVSISFPEEDFKLFLIDCFNVCLKNNKQSEPPPPKPDFKYIPIQDIFNKKICSKPTFYDHLRKGNFTLYKFGSKSFVDSEEFLTAFHKVKLANRK